MTKRILVHTLMVFTLLCLPFMGSAEEEEKTNPNDCVSYAADVVGEVEFSSDGEEWSALELNACVYPGDMLRTGAKAAVSLVLGKEALIRVNENSDFQLWNEDTESDLPNEIDMDLGELLTTLVPEEEGGEVPFQVNTPSGVVAVKGTEFHVAVDEEGKSEIKVLKGVVEVLNDLGSVLLEVGMATELLEGVLPAEPFGFDMDQFQEVLGWASALKTGDIKSVIKEKVKEEVKKKVLKGIGGGMF